MKTKKYSGKNKKTSVSQTVKKEPIPYNLEPEEAISKVEEPEAVYIRVTGNRAIFFLGMTGKKDFSGITNDGDFISVIRKGVPKLAMDNLMEITGITAYEMAGIVRLSDRTLRRYTSQTLLNPEQSERVVELAKLYSRGEDVFGGLPDFKEWMDSTVMALGNKKPKEFLDTSIGIEMLMNELGRIEHGIFA
jgi:putative toxin-antitoxin system antitoxin component (TIGR02293 family)